MTSVLVTGASGFIGRVTVRALRDAGHNVTGVARRRAEPPSICLDLRESLDRLPPVDWVVHLAGGYAGAGLSLLERDDLTIARKLLDWGMEIGVRNWVFASAAEVYGAHSEAVPEDADLRPLIPYGRVKAEIERLFLDAAQRVSGARVVLLRIGEVYGPEGNLVNELKRRFVGGFCPWFGSGNVPISFVHVDDVAQACARAVDLAPEGPTVCNVGDDEPATWRAFLDDFARLLGARPAVGLPHPVPRIYAAGSSAWDRIRRRQPMVTQHIVTLLTTPKVMANDKLKERFGIRLKYPDYRTGLATLFS